MAKETLKALNEVVDLQLTAKDSIVDQAWPPRPDFDPLSEYQRKKYFGDIKTVPDKKNPGSLIIQGDWVAKNIIQVEVPQLKLLKLDKDGLIWFNKNYAQRVQDLFGTWEKEGLLHLIEDWGGAWCVRYVRGSNSILSNHSWATAFDINVVTNWMGTKPPLVGRPGSVRELVPFANKLGWFWGGHFKRLDGMHFEIAVP